MTKKRKRHTPEQIVKKLRDAEAMKNAGQGGTVGDNQLRPLFCPPTVNRFNTRIVKKDKNWAMKPVAFTLCPFRVKPSFATGGEV